GRTWLARRGAATTAVLGATYVLGFGLSHPLAKKIGAWPAVLTVTGVAAGAAAVLSVAAYGEWTPSAPQDGPGGGGRSRSRATEPARRGGAGAASRWPGRRTRNDTGTAGATLGPVPLLVTGNRGVLVPVASMVD